MIDVAKEGKSFFRTNNATQTLTKFQVCCNKKTRLGRQPETTKLAIDASAIVPIFIDGDFYALDLLGINANEQKYEFK